MNRDIFQEREIDKISVEKDYDIANNYNTSNIGYNIIDENITERNSLNYNTEFEKITCNKNLFLKPTIETEINNIIIDLKRKFRSRI